MACDRAAFKAYDVRGTYPDQLDEAGGYAIGRAYVEFLGAERLAVGRDMRTMAPTVAAAVIRGMADAGADVDDIGLVGTEVLYDAVASGGHDGGIMVTASHNPAEYIGMKCVKRGAQPVGEDSGLQQVRDLALAFVEAGTPEGPVDGVTPGTVREVDALEAFRKRVWGFIDADKVRPLKVVVDGGNGIGPTLALPLLERLPLELHAYNAEPDGTFPNHEPNPLLEENRQFIIEKVREHGADIGIAFDGDADRCFFVDDRGEFVPGDFITAVLAELTLRREPGATVLYDVRASRAVADTIAAGGGTAIASRVGHAFIKQRIKAEGAAFAGEISGHYYFSGYHGVDTGVVPALMML
ncbi:MAG: phosphomannomutase/phosphoglucomutase, partial [Thermoleophilia bacterium]|nr:phosphomannomutase/phosphoglucomutase [Thermoleophilia bacterium]